MTRLKDKPFVLLGVSTDKEREKVLEFQRQGDVTWRSWWNGEHLKNSSKPITSIWYVSALPTLILIDHKGRVRWSTKGVPDQGELDQEIEKLIREAERDRNAAS